MPGLTDKGNENKKNRPSSILLRVLFFLYLYMCVYAMFDDKNTVMQIENTYEK